MITVLPVTEDRIYVVNGRRYLVLNIAQLHRLLSEAPQLVVIDRNIADGDACVDIGPA